MWSLLICFNLALYLRGVSLAYLGTGIAASTAGLVPAVFENPPNVLLSLDTAPETPP